MTGLLFILIGTFIPVCIATMFIPYWTRRTESFGVSIPEEMYQSVTLTAMRKKYVWITGAISVLMIIALLLFAKDEQTAGIVFSVLITIYLIAGFIIYLRFHKQMKQMKRNHPEWTQKIETIVIDSSFRSQKLTVSHAWFLIPFAISIESLIFTIVNYDKIPQQVPMQYDFSGNVSTWSEKSYKSVLLMPMMQLFMTFLFLFINIIIAKAKQQINTANKEVSIQQNVLFRYRWSMFLLVTGTLLTMLFAMYSISLLYPVNAVLMRVLPLLVTLGVVGGAIILSITTGQGGSRVQITKTATDGSVIDRDDDRYWKLGVFYFNPQDPSIFLEKRFGVGWTNNWAHPISWIFIIVILGIAIGLPLYLS